MTTRKERIEIAGPSGVQLAARLDRPTGTPRAYALFAHCFTCTKDLKAVARIAQTLVEDGIALLRFDFTGLGESEGEFADTNFTTNLDDLVAAADYLREQHEPPRLLIGHSLGGAAVLVAAARIPEALAVATIGAPSDLGHLADSLRAASPEIDTDGEAAIMLAGRPFKIRRQLLDDLDAGHVEDAVGRLGLPLLIFHSPVDDTVPIEHARRIYEAARHPKSFVSLDGADHLLLAEPRDAEFVASTLASWFARLLPADKPLHAAHSHGRTPEGEVVVEGGPAGFATEIHSGVHLLPADEPERLGGTETGPGPYDYLLAALGSCKVMTMRMYADRKGWPLAGTRVRLSHSRVHASDCEDCESDGGMVAEIDTEIEVLGELTIEQRQRIYEIADRCPVHRTLEAEIKVRSRLYEP